VLVQTTKIVETNVERRRVMKGVQDSKDISSFRGNMSGGHSLQPSFCTAPDSVGSSFGGQGTPHFHTTLRSISGVNGCGGCRSAADVPGLGSQMGLDPERWRKANGSSAWKVIFRAWLRQILTLRAPARWKHGLGVPVGVWRRSSTRTGWRPRG